MSWLERDSRNIVFESLHGGDMLLPDYVGFAAPGDDIRQAASCLPGDKERLAGVQDCVQPAGRTQPRPALLADPHQPDRVPGYKRRIHDGTRP